MPNKDKRTPLAIVEAFAQKASTIREPVLVGIDPGSTGAIAFKCGPFYCVITIPVIITKMKKTRRSTRKQFKKTGKRTRTVNATNREFDYPAICAIFRTLKLMKARVVVMLERIPPTIGMPGRKYAEIMLNRAYMMWPLFLHSKGYEVFQERPGVWKEAMKLLGKEKEDSRKKALLLFPKADILRKMDHDRAEALLLVEYLRRLLAKRKTSQ